MIPIYIGLYVPDIEQSSTILTVKYGYRPKDLRKIGFSWEPIKKRSSGCENHQQSKDPVKLKSPLSNLRGNKKKNK